MKRRSCASSATSARRCGRCRVRALPRRTQRLRRRVALDAFVDVDTVRYSVPHRLVRDHVEVVVEEQRVQIFHGAELVATHAAIHRAVRPRGRSGALRRACGASARATDGPTPARSRCWGATWPTMPPSSRTVANERRHSCARRRAAHAPAAALRRRAPRCRAQ